MSFVFNTSPLVSVQSKFKHMTANISTTLHLISTRLGDQRLAINLRALFENADAMMAIPTSQCQAEMADTDSTEWTGDHYRCRNLSNFSFMFPRNDSSKCKHTDIYGLIARIRSPGLAQLRCIAIQHCMGNCVRVGIAGLELGSIGRGPSAL